MKELPAEERDEEGTMSHFDEVDGYRNRYQYASAYFLETMELQRLISSAIHHNTPSAIWQACQDKFP